MEPDIKEIYKSNKYLKNKKDLKNITARELATAISLRKAIKKLKIKMQFHFIRLLKGQKLYETTRAYNKKLFWI